MSIDRMDAAPATELVNKMITLEIDRPTNGMVPAMWRLVKNFNLSFWVIDHLRRQNRAKTVEVSVFQYIKRVYMRLCISQASKLIEEVIELSGDGDEINYSFALEALHVADEILEQTLQEEIQIEQKTAA